MTYADNCSDAVPAKQTRAGTASCPGSRASCLMSVETHDLSQRRPGARVICYVADREHFHDSLLSRVQQLKQSNNRSAVQIGLRCCGAGMCPVWPVLAASMKTLPQRTGVPNQQACLTNRHAQPHQPHTIRLGRGGPAWPCQALTLQMVALQSGLHTNTRPCGRRR